MKNIMVISQDNEVTATFQASWGKEITLSTAPSLAKAKEDIRHRHCDLIFVDMEILYAATATGSYKAVYQPFWQQHPNLQIVVMAKQEMLQETVIAIKQGAGDCLMYPISTEEIQRLTTHLSEAQKIQSELDYLRDQFWDKDAAPLVQIKCPAMQKVFANVRSVAPTKSTVLLTGETGTGKGVLARLIHQHSNRKDKQFISVHCGAIPDTLLESELFGHEKGAFTGAVKRKLGKFELAHDGTIFLDEIGTLTSAAQIKLLQVLQDGVFQRIGGEAETKVNVRIIAATNEDLKQLCKEKLFRNDLYYRLNVFPIEIPPLRQRKEDIPAMVETFLHRLNRFHSKEIIDIDPQVIEDSQNYSWPGNIRELENILERAYILERSNFLIPESFPEELFANKVPESRMQLNTTLSLAEVRKRGVAEIERSYLQEVLQESGGKINISAETAGISTRQLHKLMTKYDLRKEDFKKE